MNITVKTKDLLEMLKRHRKAYRDHLRALAADYAKKHPRPSISKWARKKYEGMKCRDGSDLLQVTLKNMEEKKRALEAKLDRIKRFEDLPPGIGDHTSDYDCVIEFLEWHQGETVELTQAEFNRFVRDEWEWNTRPPLPYESGEHLRRVS